MIMGAARFQGARAQHNARFATLPHHALVRRVVARFKSKLSPAIEFDDLFQVGYLALMHAQATFDGRGRFEGYAALLVQRRLIDELRRSYGDRRYKQHPHLQADFSDPADRPPHGPDAVEKHLQQLGLLSTRVEQPDVLRRKRLAEALRSLTAREQRIIVDVFVHERRQEDIGPTLGVSATRVHQLYHRALGKLRKRLKEVA